MRAVTVQQVPLTFAHCCASVACDQMHSVPLSVYLCTCVISKCACPIACLWGLCSFCIVCLGMHVCMLQAGAYVNVRCVELFTVVFKYV